MYCEYNSYISILVCIISLYVDFAVVGHVKTLVPMLGAIVSPVYDITTLVL